jgi:hypothetical protein
VVKLLAVPAAVVGGIAVFRKARGGGGDEGADVGRPLGPVASADTVSPPAATAEAAERTEAERAESERAQSETAEAHASST